MTAILRSGERGKGRLGCLFSLLLLAVFTLAGTRVIPMLIDRVNFDEGMARIASLSGVNNWGTPQIRTQVTALAKVQDFLINEGDIVVTRTPSLAPVPEIRIDVRYRRPLELFGYVYVFEFQGRYSSFVGRL